MHTGNAQISSVIIEMKITVHYKLVFLKMTSKLCTIVRLTRKVSIEMK